MAKKDLLRAGILGTGLLAAGAHIWARHIEINLYQIRVEHLEILPPGLDPIKVLHFSDAHLLPKQYKKRKFLRFLATIKPDLVVNTGDNISSPEAIPALRRDLYPLLQRPGVFVFGSNDKFVPKRKNPLRYLLPDSRPKNVGESFARPDMPVEKLREVLASGGWSDLNNARALIRLPEIDLEFVGVDDPHIEHDEFPAPDAKISAPLRVEDPVLPGTDEAELPLRPRLKIGVTHAPYARVLDELVADGAELVFAGHTHGGQLAVPYFGALVTNCDLPRSQAKGLSEHGGVPLHVSGGLGANPYTNMRIANPPEATLLILHPRPEN